MVRLVVEAAGNTVDANVGGDLNIASQQDTNVYDSQQTSAGFQASLCVPPICYGTTVSGSANASDQTIKDNYQSVGQQSGLYAGNGGYNVNVGNHTQLDGGVIASTATPDRNSLSTQTLGYTNLQNTASYSGESMGFGVSGSLGQSTTDGVNLNTPVKQAGSSTSGPLNSSGFGPSGFGVSGTSSDASGTTYAAVSPGTITVRGDAGTGQDSTAGLSRDTANANGSVQNTFNAQSVQNDMAIQQMTGQVGMQVVGDIGDHMQQKAIDSAKQAVQDYNDAQKRGDTAGMAQAQADYTAANQQYALWGNDGAARIASHAVVAGVGAGMGGGSVAGAVGGTVAGDVAGNAASNATDNTLGGALLSNVASGLAGAAAGGALGGSAGALSGAGGALSADLYNRQLHPDERTWAMQHANDFAAYYASVTGQAISSTDAQNMLLANGYIRVDNLAASGPGYNAVAAQYITQNAGGLFTATPTEYNSPFLYGNSDHSLTPEQAALPGAVGNPAVGLGAAAAITGALAAAPAVVAGTVAAIEACAANPVLCVNQASIGLGEIAAGGAMPAGTGAAAALASEINNFYRDGASPELLTQAYNQAALSSTHNASSSEVILGSYVAGSPNSYEAVARTQGATYFSMSDWSQVQGQLGAENMWNINQAFLDQQIAQGKSFAFTSNPANARAGSYTQMEYQYLESQGYTFIPDSSGLYHANKQ